MVFVVKFYSFNRVKCLFGEIVVKSRDFDVFKGYFPLFGIWLGCAFSHENTGIFEDWQVFIDVRDLAKNGIM